MADRPKLNGKINLAPLTGSLPEATPAPAPGALPLLLVALAGLAAVVRRRAA